MEDDDDDYGEGDFEASVVDASGGEDEVRPPVSLSSEAAVAASVAPRQRSRALADALAVNDDALLGSDDDDDDDADHSKKARLRSKTQTRKAKVSGQHLLDNSRWTFTIRATRIRALQLPVTTRSMAQGVAAREIYHHAGALPPIIRELRVFAVLDKQSMQSRGSEWKREPRPETPRLQKKNLRERTKRSVAAASRVDSGLSGSNRASPSSALFRGRRNGFLDEAKWRDDHGKLQWTFSMETFRRLKAYAPRVKVLVYGIGTNAADDKVEMLSEDSAQKHKESIVSFGWFFLDLRTPDLPEKWFKLQNSPFGGEILICTGFVPFGHDSALVPPVAKSESKVSSGSKGESQQNRSFAATSGNAGSIAFQKNVPMVAVEDGEFLRLGSRHGADVFVISVSLQAAFNLVQVVEMTLGSRKTAPETYKAGFWLSYSLFDVVVRTDVFHNLDTSEFPPIRDSFRVMSCLDDLRDCFQQQNLAIYLCTYNRVLAGVEIPFSRLLDGELFARSSKSKTPVAGTQAVVVGNFPFPSTNGPFIDASIAVECVRTGRSPKSAPGRSGASQPEATAVSSSARVDDADSLEGKLQADQSSPVVGVQVCLDQVRLRNDVVSRFVGEEGISLELSLGRAVISGIVRFCAYTKCHVFGDNDALKLMLANLNLEELKASEIGIRCSSADSKHPVGASSSLAPFGALGSIEDVMDDPFYVEVPLHNGDQENVGQCILRLDVGESGSHEEPSPKHSVVSRMRSSNRDVHIYRVFLQLKSVRDFERPQQLSIAYQNPFTGKGKVELPAIRVATKSEVQLADSFCIFEVMEDEEQFKRDMQSSVAIDFLSHSDSRQSELIGSGIFSLNFLYFSEKQFCCAEASCGRTFRSLSEGEIHWEESHGDSRAPREHEGERVHAFKSCSIDIPVVSLKDTRSPGYVTSPHRIGTVSVVAYIEDMGILSDEGAVATEKLVVPQACVQEMRLYDTFSAPASISKEPPSKSSGEKRKVSIVEETPRYPTDSRAESSLPTPSSTRDATLTERAKKERQLDEKLGEISMIKESYERERDVWKQEQKMHQIQWKRRLEGMEKARMNELEEEWARREEERSNLLRTTQAEYERLEKALRSSLLELESRERRLALAEHALQRDQHTQKEENELFRKRLQSDHSHALSIAQKQAESHERRIAMLEAQLDEAEKRARQVESDFTDYRQQQRKVPESRLREEISALKGTILELEKQKMQQEKLREAAEANVENLKVQLEKMAKLIQNERKKNETRVVEELEKLRVKYIAREERYVLDGDREELRAIKKQLDELKGINLRNGSELLTSHQWQRDGRSLSPQQSQRLRHHRDSRDLMQRSGHTMHPGRFSHKKSKWGSQSSFTDNRRRDSRELSHSQDDFKSSLNDSSEYYDDDEEGFEGIEDVENLHHHNADLELERLERERKLLLASGAYNEQSYLVRELGRLIELTKAKGRQHQDPIL